MTEDLLTCADVTKSYGGVHAVRSVSFTLRRGEVLGLVGPNGAGKTTLVDLITGIQRTDAGRVTLSGRRLTGPPSRRARQGLARTFQHPQLALGLTVRENLLVGRAAVDMRSPVRMVWAAVEGMVAPRAERYDQEIEDIAETLGLIDLERVCADLTLGELRLVEVARALLRQPAVLLLDEPFAGSDARGVSGVRELLARVLSTGCSILLVDHNVDIVASLVGRILLMDQGAVVFDGDPAACMRSAEMQAVYFGVRNDA
jgi:branched-chain amino acid transport system ATP-binding protein